MSWLFSRAQEQESTNRKILRAALTVGLLGALAKTGAAAKDLIVAQTFGRNDALDAFLIALLLPSYALNLVMGALGSALIPVFVEIRQKQGPDGAQKLLSSFMFLSLIALTLIAALLGSLAPYYLPFLGSSFGAEKLRLTRELLYCLLPFVLFNGFAIFVSAVLNADKRFALPVLIPIVTPVVTIMLIWLGPMAWGVFLLAGGMVAGSVLEAALLLRALTRHGMRLSFRWNGADSGVRSVLGQYAPMLAGSFLFGGTAVVDQSMAAMLPSGSVAALSYASKIVGLILAIGATALSTAAFPYFSDMVAQKDWNGCRHTLKRYSMLVLATTVPLVLVLIAFSRPAVRLIFERGSFTSADTDLVSRIQVCYFIQIPFYICAMLFARFLSSIRRNDLLMYGSAISLILDVLLNLVLMKQMGIAGIALSTSLVLLFAFCFLGAWSVRMLDQEYFSAVAAHGVIK